ncbi:hypothetical protein [Sinorhizobium sp. A49]|uniref:hypothetical protein n=1 Tax=Sinorhizobium sp. A49 TaxID=1945861 RepID=UPI001115981C|nr:hypothetical protein [Sinorhizobium sp. A49]
MTGFGARIHQIPKKVSLCIYEEGGQSGKSACMRCFSIAQIVIGRKKNRLQPIFSRARSFFRLPGRRFAPLRKSVGLQ